MSMFFVPPNVDPFTGETVQAPFVRSPFSRLRLPYTTEGESRTHQAHADACDVNKILARYERTGVLPPATRQGAYADVTGLQVDLTQAINTAQDVTSRAREFASTWKPKPPEAPTLPAAAPST